METPMTRSHVPLALPMVGNDKFLRVTQTDRIFDEDEDTRAIH